MIEATAETIKTLSTLPLFQGMDAAGLEWVTQRMYRRVFPAGFPVLLAEQPGEAVYFILEGTVKVFVDQANKKPVVLSILGAGEVLGELSLLDSTGHSASAVTMEDTLMVWMDKPSFYQLLGDFPHVNINLVHILSARLRSNIELIQALTTLDTYGRIARQLLIFADGNDGQSPATIPLMLTQGDLADLVGASRKRVNQVMVYFRDHGLISVTSAGKISLLDREGLESYCK